MKFRITQTNALRGSCTNLVNFSAKAISRSPGRACLHSRRSRNVCLPCSSSACANRGPRTSNQRSYCLAGTAPCKRAKTPCRMPTYYRHSRRRIADDIRDCGCDRRSRHLPVLAGSLPHGYGQVPRQTGTSGRIRQLGLSERGNPYLRTLRMHSARSVILRGIRTPWLDGSPVWRPFNVVVAAAADKLARSTWVVLFCQTRWEAPANA